MTAPALSLAGVHKDRGTGARARPVLRGIDLEVAPGEVLLVEGPSGGGKTTLLSVAAGLLRPDRGEVWLAGSRLDTASPAGRRGIRSRHVGFVFQRANLVEGLTVLENVAVAGAIAGMGRGEAIASALVLLGRLGLDALADRPVHTLSGGEEHRVALARALVHRPTVVFADEPTGQLDRASGQEVARALADQARALGVAVLIASHDPRLRPIAHRRLWMEDGTLSPGVPDVG